LIELKLHEPNQLFNLMDPDPFIEKDLDAEAEDFIVSSAKEFPLPQPLRLLVHLPAAGTPPETPRVIEEAIRHFFLHRSEAALRELRQLFRQARFTLLVGLAFLGSCLALGQVVSQLAWGGLGELLRESLLICGWVAMWRPMELCLYDWWPLLRNLRIARKLSAMPVEVRLQL